MSAIRRLGARGAIVAYVAAVALAVTALAGRSPQSTPSPPRLESSAPADLSTLAHPPDAVYLAFNARPVPDLSHVAVVDSAGAATQAGPVSADGDGLRVPVRIPATGAYTLAFHAIFDDGAELVGQVRFGVGTGVPAASAARADQDPAAAVHEHGVDPVSAVLLLVDAATLIGAVALLLFRRPRSPEPDAHPSPTS